MADCSNAVVFSSELYRLCETDEDEYGEYGACSDTCPFNNDGERNCPFDRQITQEDVDIVQKWSDEHPVPKPKTYADDFFEKFPEASRVADRPAFCRGKIYRTPCRVAVNGMNILDECDLCWNEVMPE